MRACRRPSWPTPGFQQVSANHTEPFVRKLIAADVSGAVGALRERFSLVLLTERLTESVVLLRSMLCWRWCDVLLQAPLPPLTYR